jgi:hypothetical protein
VKPLVTLRPSTVSALRDDADAHDVMRFIGLPDAHEVVFEP